MYLSFYGFTQKPFQDSTQLDFLWLGEPHKEALTLLKEGILNTPGLFLLTGDIGTGKTILSNELMRSFGTEVIVARVPDPGLEDLDFLNCIADAFRLDRKFATRDAFYIHFEHFVDTVARTGKRLLLIIDECQRIRPDQLEEIGRLTDIGQQEAKILNILLIGQTELTEIVQKHGDGALHQRLAISLTIPPLNLAETEAFVHHRLTVAGGDKNTFTSDAIREIYEFSAGIARKIIIICDHALLSGFIKDTKILDGKIVRECGKYFNPPELTKKPDIQPQEEAVAHSSAATLLRAEPAEDTRKIDTLPVWATLGPVVLIISGVLLLTYIIYPTEYISLFSRTKEKAIQIVDLLKETKTATVNTPPGPAPDAALPQWAETKPLKGDTGRSPDAFPETPAKSERPDAAKLQAAPEKISEGATPPTPLPLAQHGLKDAGVSDNAPDSPETTALQQPGQTTDPAETRQEIDLRQATRPENDPITGLEQNRNSDSTTSQTLEKNDKKDVDRRDYSDDFQAYSELKEQMIQKIKNDQSLQSSE